MPRVALAFFTVAPIYGLVGMVWGMVMAATQDHSMFPAHAHLNLLGMVLNAIFGTFYALANGRAGIKLAWANFFLSNAAVVIMIPTLARILAVGDANAGPLIPIITVAEVLAVLGLGTFLLSVLSLWRKPAAVSQAAE